MAENNIRRGEDFQEIEIRDYQGNPHLMNNNPQGVYPPMSNNPFINPPVYNNLNPLENHPPVYQNPMPYNPNIPQNFNPVPQNPAFFNANPQQVYNAGAPNPNSPIYYTGAPNSNAPIYYTGNPPNIMIQNPPQSQVILIPAQNNTLQQTDLTEEDLKIIKFSRYVRYMSLTETLVDFLYLFSVPALLIFIILDPLGYIGAR